MPAPQDVAPTQLDSTQEDHVTQEAPAKRPNATQELPYTVLECGEAATVDGILLRLGFP